MDLFFRDLIPKPYSLKGEISIIEEIKNVIERQPILYYPSAGFDTNDIFYVSNQWIEEIGEYSPTIYIHSDKGADPNGDYFENKLYIEKLFIISKLIFYNDDKSINIYKLKQGNCKEVKWLFFFSGYVNEDVLKILLKYKIKIPIIYAICDGITHGMFGGYEKSIPTILYPLLPTDFGVKLIITEQGWDAVKRILDYTGYKTQRKWLNNILLISENEFISDSLNLSDEELKERIRQTLSVINEQFINRDNKFRCYDHRFSDRIKIKKLN